MLTEKRQEDILKLVNEKQSMTVQELKEIFNASESTIRRDILSLHKQGKLQKVFGGAIALDTPLSTKELSVVQKETINRDAKIKIAQCAASLIEPEDFVFIDAGTTTDCMIDFISEKNATYVTNAVAHAKRLALLGFKVILIGGELKGSTEAVAGTEAVINIQKYHFSKGFFGVNGVSIRAGLTTPDISEALVKRTAINNTQPQKRFVLCDNMKFGQISAVTFSMFDGVEIITDMKPDEAFYRTAVIRVV